MSTPAPAPAPKPRKRVSGLTLLLLLVILGAAGGYYWYEQRKNKPEPVDEFLSLRPFFLKLGENQSLADGYVDQNKDLIADAPTDPAMLLKVDSIGFCVVGTDDPDRQQAEEAEWKSLMDALSQATGKPVVYVAEATSPEAQMEALKSGRLHVTAFNTGAVPMAVNTAGFVPLYCPADSGGNYAYRMQILVRADSPIQKPEDLKGKTIGFVALSSNSGAKAPISVLKEKFGMLPGRDYQYKFSGSHEASLADLAFRNEYDAVCVASDLKDRAIANGVRVPGEEARKPLRLDQFREIFVSDPFPPLCFGITHKLPPEVRAPIEKTFIEYQFAGSSAKANEKQGKAKFSPVNYDADWKFVREIDTGLSRFAEIK